MSTVISGGFSFELVSVGGKWSWKVISDNISNYGQYYYVGDIRGPFGSLYDVNTPIPAEVVDAMAESLNTFRAQLIANLALVSPSSVTATVSEGDSLIDAGNIIISNAGALGSFLSASATSSDTWLIVNPSSLLGINKNQTGNFLVKIDPTNLFNSSSPYSGVINLQNINNPLSVIPVVYTVNVLPRPDISVSSNTLNFSYDINSNVISGVQTVDIINSGPPTSQLSYYLGKIQNRSPWLSFSPTSGGPVESGDSETITFTPSTSSVTKVAGVYTDTISVSSVNAVSSPVLITVTLTVY